MPGGPNAEIKNDQKRKNALTIWLGNGVVKRLGQGGGGTLKTGK